MIRRAIVILMVFCGDSALAAPIVEKVPLALKSGRVIGAELRIPEFTGRAPALLVFGGFQHAGEVLELIHTRKPVILASFDYPFDAPRRFEFPGSLALIPDARTMVHETLEAIPLLVRELRNRRDVDSSRITIIGASLGAPFAALAAARNPEIRGLVLIDGFGEVPAVITHQLLRAWQPRYGNWVRLPAFLLGKALWALLGLESPEQAVTHLHNKQHSLVIYAEHDSFIPLRATQSLLRAFEGRYLHRSVQMPGDHLQPGADRQIEQIMRQVETWLQAVDLGPQFAALLD